MKKILSYPLTAVYYCCFGLILIVFHAIQWICLNVFGYKVHKISVDILQFFLMRCTNILGTRYTFINKHDIPESVPLIIVSNHQSMYDIPPLIWHFKKNHPKFISKKQLGKGIPSVSYNLRHGGSVLIDRKNPKQSLEAIKKFGKCVAKNNWSAVIFPEGTRSISGTPKPFKTQGLLTLFSEIPNAVVIPVTINNSWKLMRYGGFPCGLGAHIKIEVHKPLTLSKVGLKEAFILQLEKQIAKSIVIEPI